MSSNTGDESPFGQLPVEILVKIFCLLDSKSLVFSASRVNYRWRTIIQQNLRKMKLVPAHCRVDVMDMDPTDESVDGRHPMIQYTFTVFDDTKADYKNKLKCCWRANGNWTQLYLTHRVGLMECEWESADDQRRPVKADSTVVEGLLKYMRIEAIRFDVRKIGRRTTARATDEKFAHIMDFCFRVCTEVDLKSLLLTSHSLNFPWCFGPLSRKRLYSLRIKNLILENMTATECFGEGNALEHVDLSQVRYLHLKLDPTHRQELENILWVDINGTVLTSLLTSHQHCLEFRVYSECPQVISLISAEDMISFLRGWRGLLSPWIIRGIHFNATFTISEFRTVAARAGLMGDQGILVDFPYCRFRTFHPADPNAVLELTCFGNMVSTQWQIRSGYSRT